MRISQQYCDARGSTLPTTAAILGLPESCWSAPGCVTSAPIIITCSCRRTFGLKQIQIFKQHIVSKDLNYKLPVFSSDQIVNSAQFGIQFQANVCHRRGIGAVSSRHVFLLNALRSYTQVQVSHSLNNLCKITVIKYLAFILLIGCYHKQDLLCG